jgi:4-hydroxy-3-methylbut-2-enyl diphosphate reductase
MGQYNKSFGGDIYLVDSPLDVETLKVKNKDKLGFVTQTTLSMDDTAIIIEALRNRFPKIEGPKKDDICYATQNRQDALKKLANQSDIVLVVGSPNSSNSNRLREIAEKKGIPAYLIDGAEDIDKAWFTDEVKKVGITAGASAPEILVEEVNKKLASLGAEILPDDQGIIENVSFVLPKELR